MPFYEYQCSNCGTTAQSRRSYDAMNDPGPACVSCQLPTERIFSPTANLFVPQAFQHTWSDFHDVTEKELAHTEPNLEPINRLRSQPSGEGVKKAKRRADLERAFVDAKAKTDAIYSNRGLATDA